MDRWLNAGGWLPARDIGARAEELIALRQADAAQQGEVLIAPDSAIRFVRSFGDLELDLPGTSPARNLILKSTVGYEGDTEDIVELAGNLATQLFPVAYETIEGGIWLIDTFSRFFYLHHTGAYFLGADQQEAFMSTYAGRSLQDAEDYYA
ncbi:SUKH-3 domain-containing protein [Nocardia tengchongensis]|uniref:SUKH-3 domain-containing protein n=1 Tax=Nocardia tengchongensis TaxID=2055889 RepID=UPI00367A3C3C